MMRPVGKRRTREHIIADQSVCYVEWQALRCGFAVQRVFHDYGIDLEIDTFSERGEIQAGTILMQVKATDHLKLRPGQSSFGFRIERSHLVLWLSELEPVILVVYDAKKVVAYWICVQDYFAALPKFNLFAAGKSITVRIPVVNRVNAKAMRTFSKLRDHYRKHSRLSHD
jgi:hypothetical protein